MPASEAGTASPTTSIGILLCYFGEWPPWGNLFLESCRYNPTVDFLLFTDHVPPFELSPNVRVIELDLAGFQALGSRRLGCEMGFDNISKLHDLKPATGVIFEDYLRDYDFWGYCDLDVVFGDLRAFLDEELLARYDVISARREFPAAHLTLFRNVERITRLYERSRDYEKVLTSDEFFNFEECGFIHPQLLWGGDFDEVASEATVDSLMHVLARSPDVRTHLETLCAERLDVRAGYEGRRLRIRWQRGKVVDELAGRELLYYHLHFLKDELRFYMPRWETMPEAFVITHRGIFRGGEQSLGQRLKAALERQLVVAGRVRRFCGLFLKACYVGVKRKLASLGKSVRSSD